MSRSVHSRDNSSNWQNFMDYMDDWHNTAHVSEKNLKRILLKFLFTRGLISLELSQISFSSWSTALVNLHDSCVSAFECYPCARCSLKLFSRFVFFIFGWFVTAVFLEATSRSFYLWLEAMRRKGLRTLSSVSSKVLRAEPTLGVSCLGCPNFPFLEPQWGQGSAAFV